MFDRGDLNQSVEGLAWFLQTVYSKNVTKEKSFGNELVKHKKPELKDLVNSQPILIGKNEKVCSEENSKGVAKRSYDKEINVTELWTYRASSIEARNYSSRQG